MVRSRKNRIHCRYKSFPAQEKAPILGSKRLFNSRSLLTRAYCENFYTISRKITEPSDSNTNFVRWRSMNFEAIIAIVWISFTSPNPIIVLSHMYNILHRGSLKRPFWIGQRPPPLRLSLARSQEDLIMGSAQNKWWMMAISRGSFLGVSKPI